jgi:hypothetical protein
MNKSILTTIVIILIVLNGCGMNRRGSSSGPTATISEQELHKGFDGLTIEFPENYPPLEVYEGDTFPVIVLLENAGASDLKGDISILLNNNVRLTKGSLEQDIELKGKSIASPEGEREIIELLIKPFIFPDTQSIGSTIIAQVGYEYKTSAVVNVCIDTDPFDELLAKGIQKACNKEDIELQDGQGAPIAVTKIITKINRNNNIPEFEIFVENKGKGKLYDLDEYPDYVDIEASLYDKKLICEDDEMSLEEGSYIICKPEESFEETQEPYISLLNIKLSYLYVETINKEITIKNKKRLREKKTPSI